MILVFVCWLYNDRKSIPVHLYVWFHVKRGHNLFWRCRIDSDMFGCFRVELILFLELILLEARICSF